MRLSISLKIGSVFLLLAIAFGASLALNAYLARQLIGASAAINHAGAQRMRAYKLAHLIRVVGDRGATSLERSVLAQEIDDLEKVLAGLENGDADLGLVRETDQQILEKIKSIREEWSLRMRPRLEGAVRTPGTTISQPLLEYTQLVPGFAAAVSSLVEAIEDRTGRRISFLYALQLVFILSAGGILLLGIAILQRVVRRPLQQLTEGVRQVTAGNFTPVIPVKANDELGELAGAFEMLAVRIRTHLQHLEALYTSNQDLSDWGPGKLDTVLKRTAETATSLVDGDAALLMVRHPILECWIVEAATGSLFQHMHKQVILFEQTPYAYQAYDTKRPVVVADVDEFPDQPVFFRDTMAAKSYLVVPLLGRHEAIGVLVLLRVRQGGAFADREIRLAQQSAAYAAIALENARLFEAAEMFSKDLQERMKAVERQVAELTHEVKAPAGRVAEFALWLQRDYADRLDDRALRYLQWIRNESADLVQLAERTLDFTRLLHEPTPLECVDSNVVVHDILAMMESECRTRGIEVHVPERLPIFACRRIHLKQVIENLLSNAIKYMGEQLSPRVEVGTTEDADGLWLFVRDNGIGMPPAMADRIFEPFQRLGAIETQGAGIGLAIVKAVVEHYGGQVRVTSRPGEGSTFAVRLPVVQGNWVRAES